MSMPRFPAWRSVEDGSELHQDGEELRSATGRRVPIVRGVPRFVGSQAYASSFGLQWTSFPKTQLDSFSGVPLSAERLRRCLGSTTWSRLPDCVVLECGCGAGRFTEILLQQGAAVMSVDLSIAVDANVDNFAISERHRVAQADILALPFDEGAFDVVICLGVIQHTPDPEATLAALWRQVAPGGVLVIDHYERGHAGTWHSSKPLVRALLRGRDPTQAMRVTAALVDFFFPLHVAVKSVYPLWFLLCRISPITTYLRMYPQLNPEAQRQWAYLDTHDSLTDFFKHERSQAEIFSCLAGLGATEIWCVVGGNGVEARGTRPRPG